MGVWVVTQIHCGQNDENKQTWCQPQRHMCAFLCGTSEQQLSDKAVCQVKYKNRIQWRNANLPVHHNGSRMDDGSHLRTSSRAIRRFMNITNLCKLTTYWKTRLTKPFSVLRGVKFSKRYVCIYSHNCQPKKYQSAIFPTTKNVGNNSKNLFDLALEAIARQCNT